MKYITYTFIIFCSGLKGSLSSIGTLNECKTFYIMQNTWARQGGDKAILCKIHLVTYIIGPYRLCSLTFEQLLAFGVTFC